MSFTQEVKKLLEPAWKEKKPIKINGINFYGKEFTSEGRISSRPHSMKIDENSITVDFGKYPERGADFSTKHFATFQTKLVGESCLSILSIEIDGKIVYNNPNKPQMIETAKNNAAKLKSKLKEEGRDKLPKCPVVDALRNLVGQPIVVDGKKYVFATFVGVAESGVPIAIETRGNCIPVGALSTLSVVDLDGNVKEIAKNELDNFLKALAEVAPDNNNTVVV